MFARLNMTDTAGDAKNEFRGFSYPETRQRPTYRWYKSEKNEFPVSRIDRSRYELGHSL